VTLTFYYDVGSPNAYLAWKALSVTPDVTLDLKPVLIGGLFKTANNQPPWQAFSGVPTKMSYMMVEIQRFARDYGLSAFKMNPHFPVNTLLSMRVATAAMADGVHDQVAPLLFTAMWEDGLNLADPEVIMTLLSDNDLDGAALVAKASDPATKQALADATQACADRGAFGLPAWFTPDDQLYFGKDCVWMMHPEKSALLPS
jgi:2-hydroxychromene-2-carboxylate isomerase